MIQSLKNTDIVSHSCQKILFNTILQKVLLTNTSYIPGDGGLSSQHGGYKVWFLWTMLLILWSQLVFRLQPPTHWLRRRAEGAWRTFGLWGKQNERQSKIVIQQSFVAVTLIKHISLQNPLLTYSNICTNGNRTSSSYITVSGPWNQTRVMYDYHYHHYIIIPFSRYPSGVYWNSIICSVITFTAIL